MELYSILYVSKCDIPSSIKHQSVRDIVTFSKSWNRSVGITGAIAFTGSHFSQYIEGPQKAVGDLLVKLLRDKRHHQVDVIEVDAIAHRIFSDWSLAFTGPEICTNDDLEPLLKRNKEDMDQVRSLADYWRRRLHDMAAAMQTDI